MLRQRDAINGKIDPFAERRESSCCYYVNRAFLLSRWPEGGGKKREREREKVGETIRDGINRSFIGPRTNIARLFPSHRDVETNERRKGALTRR